MKVTIDIVELDAMNSAIADLDKRVKVLEAGVPTPPSPIPSSTLFAPGSWPWNARLADNAVISPSSAAMVADLVSQTKLVAPVINTTQYTMPFYRVHGNATPKTPVAIADAGNNQPMIKAEFAKGIPIPSFALPGENSPDRHMAILDLDTGRYYEMIQVYMTNGKWTTQGGAICDNFISSNGVMPRFGTDNWNTATATWLPVVAGLITLQEVQDGVAPHALAMCIKSPKNAFVPPARSGDWTSPIGLIPEGTRFRLPASFVIDKTLPRLAWVTMQAIRDYGIYVRDRGGVTIYAEDPWEHPETDNTGNYVNPYAKYRKGLSSGQIAAMLQFDKWQVVA